MKISTRGRYGVRAVFDIAFYGEGKPEQIKNISARQEIPPRYLEQIFQRLKKAGIIKTKRGAKGGYYLGKDPDKITVAEIVRITDGPITPVICLEHRKKKEHCHRAKECVVKPVWDEAGRLLGEFLESITISELCRRARAKLGGGCGL